MYFIAWFTFKNALLSLVESLEGCLIRSGLGRIEVIQRSPCLEDMYETINWKDVTKPVVGFSFYNLILVDSSV